MFNAAGYQPIRTEDKLQQCDCCGSSLEGKVLQYVVHLQPCRFKDKPPGRIFTWFLRLCGECQCKNDMELLPIVAEWKKEIGMLTNVCAEDEFIDVKPVAKA